MIEKNIKDEFNKIKVPQMEFSILKSEHFTDFIQQLRKQDRKDERYLFQKRLLPIESKSMSVWSDRMANRELWE